MSDSRLKTSRPQESHPKVDARAWILELEAPFCQPSKTAAPIRINTQEAELDVSEIDDVDRDAVSLENTQ